MKKLTPAKQAKLNAKLAKKKKEAIAIIKQVVAAYKENYNYISKQSKKAPMKGVSTKALHTLLGTKIKQKAKTCNHCGDKTHNGKSLCVKCIKIPRCKSCSIMLGNWNENKTELTWNDYNRPSLLNPLICESCYARKEE
jgi:hypothetical protein